MSAKRSQLLAAILMFAAAMPAAAQRSPAQTAPTQASGTRAYVETLASEKFGGREAGSPGERLAAEYLATQLTRMGAKPLPGRSDMFVPFTFTAGSRDGGSRAVVGSTTFNTSKDVIALSFSDDGEVNAPVVFAGYGIVVPETQNFGYRSVVA